MNQKIKSFVIDTFAFLLVFGLMALCVYFIFFRSWIIDEEKRDAVISASNLYMEDASDTHFSNLLLAYKECFSRLRFGDCDYSRESELVSTLLLKGHIDQIINDFDLRVGFGLDGGINAKLMVDYLGEDTTALFMKADALVRENRVQLAIPIYKSLFERNNRYEVAVRLRGLLSYYGCTSDYEVWGEFTERQTTEVHPFGAPFPRQTLLLSTSEIVDFRIRLNGGEFVPFTVDCPINKLLP